MGAGAGAPFDLRLLPRTATVSADGRLVIGGCDVAGLASTYGTPLYVYDETDLRERCREYRTGFRDGSVAYAAKAFLCSAMARLVAEEGLHIDVATGGEAHVAHRAGFPAARMVFHGNNKSELELRLALELGVGRLVVDNTHEIDRVEQLVADGLPRPHVLVRVTPGVEAHTHEYIATGADDSKFGFTVSTGAALDAAVRVAKSDAMDFAGFHCHIGSQILVLESYGRAAEVVVALAAEAAAIGAPVGEVNLGGGLGVPYTGDDIDAPSIATYAAHTRRAFADACAASRLDPVPRLSVEAGRSIAGPAGVTLYTVGSIKDIPGVHTYVAVDGGMSDNPRPVTYGARYETFLPARVTAPRPLVATVAGKHCEQGDLLVKDAELPSDLSIGDVLATPTTGAYAYSMASNYNLVPRAAVVFVRDGDARMVVRRETLDDLLLRDVATGGMGAEARARDARIVRRSEPGPERPGREAAESGS
jgi:diaminopimelate decarboxylase